MQLKIEEQDKTTVFARITDALNTKEILETINRLLGQITDASFEDECLDNSSLIADLIGIIRAKLDGKKYNINGLNTLKVSKHYYSSFMIT